MKRKIFSLLIFTQICFSVLGQKAQKTTYIEVLERLAKQHKLELSYSSDLVSLSDSTEFIFSTNIDSCITELQEQTNLKITKTETHLIVASKAPAYIHLQGKVVDAESGELLPYANILIEKAGTGTISNNSGDFDFKIQGRYAGSEVQFSFLGYESQKLEIPFTNKNKLTIKLIPKPYTLADIFVLPNGNEAVDIVKRAVKNIKRNYARNTFQMEAFYRNTNYRDTVASQLIEAALLIQDKGITKPVETSRIQILEIRKSKNYLVPESQKEKLWGKTFERMFGHNNILYRSYNNYVRSYNTSWYYKPLTDYDNFKYEFEGFEWLDSIKVYKIKYTYDERNIDGTRASESKYAERAGYIYINSKDWGILKIEDWFKQLVTEEKLFVDNYFSKKEMGYQKINGKYYLKYTHDFPPANGSFSDSKNPDTPYGGKRQWAEATLLITNVITDKKEMDKIRYREKLARDENSYETNYPYNPQFWENYNILKENPVEERFVKEMEWEKSLNIQFEENSTSTNK